MTGINSRTIQKLLKRMRERGNIENLPRSGGIRKKTPRDDRILFRSVKTNRRQTLKDVTARFNQRIGCNVSSRTVCRTLFLEGYKRRVVYKKKITIFQVNRQRIALDSRSVVAYYFQWWDKDNNLSKSQNLCLEKGWSYKITSGMCWPSRRLRNHMSYISNVLGVYIILWRGNTDTSWKEYEHWKVYFSIRR